MPKPAANEEKAPYDISSFVERAKHENKGFKFGNGKRVIAFVKMNEGPSPLRYNVVQADAYLHTRDNGNVNASMMGRAPCQRLTDVIITDSTKKVHYSNSCFMYCCFFNKVDPVLM